MNVDATLKGISISRFLALQPKDARHDRVASGSIRRQDLSGRCTRLENLSERLPHADLGFDNQLSKRSCIAAPTIADSKFGR